MPGTKGKAIRENVELAFDVYCETGGDKSRTVEILKKKHGLSISRKTLYNWIKAKRFDERRIEVDAQRQANRKAVVTAWVSAVHGLLKVMAMYDKYIDSPEFFNAKGRPDNNAVYAYSGVLGQLRLYLRKLEYIKGDESEDESIRQIAKGITDNMADDIRNKILGVPA